jgi:predicted O-methyltransferase YrrM
MLSERVVRTIKDSLRRGPVAPYFNRLLVSIPPVYALLRYESQLTDGQLRVLRRLLDLDVPGDVIECGVYRGGTTVLMARHLQQTGRTDRMIYALDSFEGFRPDTVDREIDHGLTPGEARAAFTTTSEAYVRRKFDVLGVGAMVRVVPGFFEDTLGGLPGPFSLALVDCDLEAPVDYCLTTLWDRITPGGHLVVDDYQNVGYAGARRACDRFVASLPNPVTSVEEGFMVIRKPRSEQEKRQPTV